MISQVIYRPAGTSCRASAAVSNKRVQGVRHFGNDNLNILEELSQGQLDSVAKFLFEDVLALFQEATSAQGDWWGIPGI